MITPFILHGKCRVINDIKHARRLPPASCCCAPSAKMLDSAAANR